MNIIVVIYMLFGDYGEVVRLLTSAFHCQLGTEGGAYFHRPCLIKGEHCGCNHLKPGFFTFTSVAGHPAEIICRAGAQK